MEKIQNVIRSNLWVRLALAAAIVAVATYLATRPSFASPWEFVLLPGILVGGIIGLLTYSLKTVDHMDVGRRCGVGADSVLVGFKRLIYERRISRLAGTGELLTVSRLGRCR
jgi:hypothetical protein